MGGRPGEFGASAVRELREALALNTGQLGFLLRVNGATVRRWELGSGLAGTGLDPIVLQALRDVTFQLPPEQRVAFGALLLGAVQRDGHWALFHLIDRQRLRGVDT